MILYVENPKEYPPKYLDIMNKFSQVAGCQVNI